MVRWTLLIANLLAAPSYTNLYHQSGKRKRNTNKTDALYAPSSTVSLHLSLFLPNEMEHTNYWLVKMLTVNCTLSLNEQSGIFPILT